MRRRLLAVLVTVALAAVAGRSTLPMEHNSMRVLNDPALSKYAVAYLSEPGY